MGTLPNITTTRAADEAARRRQSRAALVLADLLAEDLPELVWIIPPREVAVPFLRGAVPGAARFDAEFAEHAAAVHAWAGFLQAAPEWVPLHDGGPCGAGGELTATGWHMGVRVVVRAWLPAAPEGGPR
ncbi:hypothetical protein F5972_08565 [Microbispora cellulosiformans]|uniref:Uncharacterized protein n=1 Tax=Microbispora cellulosiformans TaxID=2614688 RepID=A0A5J5K7M4_9ACTN|nr:hypothetical protein [Microbispora cellulosiformans]KAA9379694.1 hypothetical protein F5972_08565 [Microbispora cellulosiformans]